MGRILVVLALLGFATFPLHPKPKNCAWQEGELISVRADEPERSGDPIVYIYTVKGRDFTYNAALRTALKLTVPCHVRFAVDQKTIFVQDRDGRERSGLIFHQSANPPAR